jgi:hypothetical protein
MCRCVHTRYAALSCVHLCVAVYVEGCFSPLIVLLVISLESRACQPVQRSMHVTQCFCARSAPSENRRAPELVAASVTVRIWAAQEKTRFAHDVCNVCGNCVTHVVSVYAVSLTAGSRRYFTKWFINSRLRRLEKVESRTERVTLTARVS